MDDSVNQDAPSRKNTKPVPQNPDRIRISTTSLQRLASWNKQLNGLLRGIRLTRSDLVNFVIMSHADALTPREIQTLEAEYFDEVKFVLWAVEQKKAADARGEPITIAEILKQHRPAPEAVSRPRSRKSKKTKMPNTLDKIEQI